jgi:enoyl-CoA hydratase/carnithine racemase
MLTHCDFVYAGESARFHMPFINLAVVASRTMYPPEMLSALGPRTHALKSCELADKQMAKNGHPRRGEVCYNP